MKHDPLNRKRMQAFGQTQFSKWEVIMKIKNKNNYCTFFLVWKATLVICNMTQNEFVHKKLSKLDKPKLIY